MYEVSGPAAEVSVKPMGIPFGAHHAVECMDCCGHTEFARNGAFSRWLGARLRRQHDALRRSTMKKRIRRALRRRARQAGLAECEDQ